MFSFQGSNCPRKIVNSCSLPQPVNINEMPKFVIEREIPGAGGMTSDQLQAAAQNSLSVLRDLGP